MSLKDVFTAGQRAAYRSPEAVGPGEARYYATATEFPASGELPPTWMFDTTQILGRAADENGYAGHTWTTDRSLSIIRVGHAYEVLDPPRPGDIVHSDWEIAEVVDATRPGGRERVRIRTEVTYRREDGSPLGRQSEVVLLQRSEGDGDD